MINTKGKSECIPFFDFMSLFFFFYKSLTKIWLPIISQIKNWSARSRKSVIQFSGKKEKERKKNWSPKPRKEEKCQLTTDWRLLHTKSVQLTTYIQLVGTLPTFNTLNFNKGPDNYCKSNEEFPKTASIYDGWWTKYLININT